MSITSRASSYLAATRQFGEELGKTIVVEVTSAKPHPLYKKVVRRSRRLKAHDENNEAHIGDTVLVRECRPLSRTKTWRLIRVLERAE